MWRRVHLKFVTQLSEVLPSSIFVYRLEDGGILVIRKVADKLPLHTASHSRRLVFIDSAAETSVVVCL